MVTCRECAVIGGAVHIRAGGGWLSLRAADGELALCRAPAAAPPPTPPRPPWSLGAPRLREPWTLKAFVPVGRSTLYLCLG